VRRRFFTHKVKAGLAVTSVMKIQGAILLPTTLANKLLATHPSRGGLSQGKGFEKAHLGLSIMNPFVREGEHS
jgi:hypothetical protein